MFSKQLAALAAGASTASAVYQGFNYASGTDFATEFALAKSLAGTNGAFTSARLYTTIEADTTNTPTSAIEAAINADVSLLLGIWASGGQSDVTDEIAALTSAISTYGSSFADIVVGISVGSEDLYRITPTGIENDAGVGAEPSQITDYISQVRSAIAGTVLSGVPVGHVDTWTAWVNSSNDAVIDACDFIGMDAYPYFQTTETNAIADGYDLFFSAYDQTVSAAGGKDVWVTETGWPVSGPTENDAVASTANAETYWQAVACKLLGSTNTWWYTLDDAGASPSFGVTTGSDTPLYDLACSSSSSSSSSTAASKTSTSASSGSSTAASASTTSGSSAVASIASSVSSAASSKASASNSLVSVSISADPTEVGGSPGASSSAKAESSAESVASASPSAASVSAASASSVASAALSSASSALVAASGKASTSAAASTSGAAASGSGAAASSSAAAASASSAKASGSAVAASSSGVAASSSGAASATKTASSGSSASGTSSSTTAVASYTGSASSLRSTGGFIAAVAAMLAVF